MGSLVLNDAVARDPLRHSGWMNSSAVRSSSALETDRQHSTYMVWSSHSRPATSSSQQATPSQAQPSHNHSSSTSLLSSSSAAPTPLSTSSATKGTPDSFATQRLATGDTVADHEAPPSPRITPSDQTPSSQSRTDVTEDVDHTLEDTSRSTESSTPVASSPRRIKVRDLQHIQSFAQEDPGIFGPSRAQSSPQETPMQSPQFEISEMPVTDVIEMVAGLLTKITTTNDRQHEHLHRNPIPDGSTTMSQTTSSVLSFHGKNVPSITILSYLSRIHKYCPTTYEIFLSLLVYFDRMTDRVNSGPLQSLRRASHQSLDTLHMDRSRGTTTTVAAGPTLTETLSPPAQRMQIPAISNTLAQEPPSPPLSDSDPYLSHFFVVDSFNIHRLVIAGVTCASKFFSDVFYTNSRYAKVGGLPLVELNHLELQFLLLNDFRLSIAVEELEAYATMLVEFYAREVLAQQDGQAR